MAEVLAEKELPFARLTLREGNPHNLEIVVERWGGDLEPWEGVAVLPLELDYEAVDSVDQATSDSDIESILQKWGSPGMWEDYQLYLSALEKRG